MSRVIMICRVPGHMVCMPHPAGLTFDAAAKKYEEYSGLRIPKYFVPVVSAMPIMLECGVTKEWDDIVDTRCGAIYFIVKEDL